MERAHIIIVDDDARIRELLQAFLIKENYRVSLASSAADARSVMQGMAFDLAIIDVMMPGETGLSLAESLRASGNTVPILMLSALGDTDDRVRGLTAGSDDYLTKPFDPRELVLRIDSLLRRTRSVIAPPREVSFGAFDFHLERGELRRGQVIIKLTTREKEILRQLAVSAGEALSRQALAGEGVGSDVARAVDVQINRLRQKIEVDPANPIYLQTVRGAGYALFVDSTAS
jgi:two-component system, OmpR family, phosphate regulon response regulator OmpR